MRSQKINEKGIRLCGWRKGSFLQQWAYELIVDGSDFSKRLREIPGIGKWTAQYAAMSVLRDPDAFPSGDIALQRAIGERSAGDLEKRSEAWRPWRSYAAILLWQSNGNVHR
jgi:3-methyladenine DNA glycosylase/8-oxoguanine DNA glycosylase